MRHPEELRRAPRPAPRPQKEQFWRTTLAKWVKSGLNVRDFCSRHRLAETAFYFWRREIAGIRPASLCGSRPDQVSDRPGSVSLSGSGRGTAGDGPRIRE
jgi:hypothetical protein